jgi:hypothetical protein
VDLGDGETSACRKALNSAEIYGLEIEKQRSIPSAVGVDRSGQTRIGVDALLSYEDLTSLEINFKRTVDSTSNGAAPLFLETILKGWAKDGVDVDASYLYVGCPSEWNPSEREDYRRLLATARVKGVEACQLISESRAALVWWLKRQQDLDLGFNKWKQRDLNVLVVDIGSSTTDFTFVRDTLSSDQTFDDGITLGGRQIDQALFNYFVENHKESHRLRDLLATHQPSVSRCLYVCRVNKEEFFANEAKYTSSSPDLRSRCTEKGHVDVRGSGIYFFAPVTSNIINEVTRRLRIQGLGGQTWVDAFVRKVRFVKMELSKLGLRPSRIVMTGGASRMEFTRQILIEEFAMKEPSMLVRDQEPQFSIAYGVTIAGDIDVKAQQFRADVERFAAIKLPALVASKKEQLVDTVASALTSAFLQNALRRGLRAYRDGRVGDGDALKSRIANEWQQWTDSSEYENEILASCTKWLESIKPDLDQEPRELCRKYELPDDSLVYDKPFTLEDVRLSAAASYSAGGVRIGLGISAAVATLILASGPAAPLMAIGALLGGLFFGGQIARALMSDEKIDQLCSEKRSEIRTQISSQLRNSSDMQALLARIQKHVQNGFIRRAERARKLLDLV